MNLNDFVNICDDVIKNTNPTKGQAPLNPSAEDLYQKITELCAKNSGAVQVLIKPLIKELAIASVCQGHQSSPYHQILKVLWDAVRPEKYEKGDIKAVNWPALIATIYENKENSHFFEQNGDDFFQNELDLAHSCKSLINQNIQIEFSNGGPTISSISHPEISEKIDVLCRRIGGYNIIKETLSTIEGKYNPHIDRFLIFRTVSMGPEMVETAIPYGYLISLGVKYLNVSGEKQIDYTTSYTDLRNYLRDIVAIFEIQPYSMWEDMYIGADDFIPFLQSTVIYDNLVAFPQINNKHAKEIIKGTLAPFFEKEHKTTNGILLHNIYMVSVALIDLSGTTALSSHSLKKIVNHTNLPKNVVKDILDQYLSHERDKPNSNFNYPPLNTDIDANFKPAFSKKDGTYLLMPKCLTALAVMNAILNLISRPNGKFDNASDSELGTALENYINAAFKKKGIQSKSGKFLVKTAEEGDCDLVVETENYVFIFEIKKKQLTRQALSGFDRELLFDCGDSFLRSQSQAIRTEWILRKNDTLKVLNTEGEEKAAIHLNGRHVERVSLSLYDFGSLHDNRHFKALMEIIIAIEVNSQHSKTNQKLDEWREYVQKIREHCLLLENQNPASKGYPFKNSSFMSIPQLLFILTQYRTEDKFEKAILKLKHMTTGTRDFYVEHLINLNMEKEKMSIVKP